MKNISPKQVVKFYAILLILFLFISCGCYCSFAQELSTGSGYPIGPKDIKFARSKPNTFFAWELTQNPNYKIEQIDKDIARKKSNTFFALGITKNLNSQGTSLDNYLEVFVAVIFPLLKDLFAGPLAEGN